MSVTFKSRPMSAAFDDVPVEWMRERHSFWAWHGSTHSSPYSVVLTSENIGSLEVPDWRWHVSVAGERDVPAWRPFSAIVHAVRPGVNFVSGLPSEAHWINVNPNVLHAFELKDQPLLDQWIREGRGDTPT